ncbi:MAG TPA: methyltransferase domain-containing protein [Verrucomicrobiae bacterium]|uniref:tRNA (guanine(46)-N(7))-methyltransferase TrmB n=1 Tax=Noviherbaspirillum sp. TaxID=1926288 RepID=UPI002D269454|nr:methyltransferase domain-containing protein [Noviherbaspirillum sp.]HYG21311.1 methyltransferase domain-containing protein [Verrucomicrobiae bacterium]HZW21237.1 methyltransferase domain-containing protein [Noviherbaspirillum sp.]
MDANSRPVTSAQEGVHEQLPALVARHARSEYRKPFMPYNRDAFETSVAAWRAAGSRPLILDAGCGVGLSTRHLARTHPAHFVIGVDQSADRLARNTAWEGPVPANFICVRADLVDYWRLMLAADIRPAKHFILYPNPWPKIGHLARRWHGHPVFPVIVALGGEIECRSNWRIYVEEFAAALAQLSGSAVTAERFAPAGPITPFEKKYADSGHSLWRCAAVLPS